MIEFLYLFFSKYKPVRAFIGGKWVISKFDGEWVRWSHEDAELSGWPLGNDYIWEAYPMDENIFKIDINQHVIKWYEWIWLWAFPTYEVYEGDSVHFFKEEFGRIYYIREEQA